jgi:hypothetical protein
MAKYNDLIQEFSQEIESIKALQAKKAEINTRLTKAYGVGIVDGDEAAAHFFSCEAIADEMSQVLADLHAELACLSHEVEMAYWDVPYAKPRQQGMAKFWELSGLRD